MQNTIDVDSDDTPPSTVLPVAMLPQKWWDDLGMLLLELHFTDLEADFDVSRQRLEAEPDVQQSVWQLGGPLKATPAMEFNDPVSETLHLLNLEEPSSLMDAHQRFLCGTAS